MIQLIQVAVPEHRAVPRPSKVSWSSPYHSNVAYEEYLKEHDYQVGVDGVKYITREVRHNGLCDITTVKVYRSRGAVIEFTYAPHHCLHELIC